MTAISVREIMQSKAYYSYEPETGEYNWPASVQAIAQALHRPDIFDQIKKTIENSFTPHALTKVRIKRDKKIIEEPLIKCIKQLGINPYIWTVGDLAWQKTKFENCGLNKIIDSAHYLPASKNKKTLIRNFIEKPRENEKKIKLHLYIVDDKERNLDEVMKELNNLAQSHNIILHLCYIDSKNPLSPTTFYNKLIIEQKEIQEAHEEMELFLDMDGVVIDTDGIMNGIAVENVNRLLL